MMMTRTYNKVQPYGKLTILATGKRYFLLAPVPLWVDEWTEQTGMQAWSCFAASDGMPDVLEYSKELNAILHDEAITLIVHPTNIAIELSDQIKEMYYWSGKVELEAEEETEVDLSEDNDYIQPDYLTDVVNEPLDEQYPVAYMTDGFPV